MQYNVQTQQLILKHSQANVACSQLFIWVQPLAPPAEVWILLYQALYKCIVRYDSCVRVFTVKKRCQKGISQAKKPRWFNRLKAELRVELECFDICFDILIVNQYVYLDYDYLNENPQTKQKRVHLQISTMNRNLKPQRKDPSLESWNPCTFFYKFVSVLWELKQIGALLCCHICLCKARGWCYF